MSSFSFSVSAHQGSETEITRPAVIDQQLYLEGSGFAFYLDNQNVNASAVDRGESQPIQTIGFKEETNAIISFYESSEQLVIPEITGYVRTNLFAVG